MLNSFFQRTASVAALLLAAGGMHVPLLASTTVKQPALKAHVSGKPAFDPLRGPHHFGKSPSAKTAKNLPHTPFSTIMLPRIKADMAKNAAANAALGIRTSSPRKADAPSVNSVNFGGFQNPTVFTSIPLLQDDADLHLTVTADFNKDGKPDLATVQEDGELNVLLNGATTFSISSPISSTNTSAVAYTGLSLDTMQAADLNHDGYPDIEVVDQFNGYALIWMNNGDGTFGTVSVISIALPAGDVIYSEECCTYLNNFYGDVVFADVTGDNRPDMIVVSGSQTAYNASQLSISVFNGVGDGTFPSLPSTTSSTPLSNTLVLGSYHSLQVADVNNDGNLDLIFPAVLASVAGVQPNQTYTEFSYAYVLTGNNLGLFSPIPTLTPSSAGVFGVQTVNVDNYDFIGFSYFGPLANGTTGLLFTELDAGLIGMVSNGDGTLQAPTVTSPDTSFATIQFADVTGDGKPDAIFYNNGYMSIYNGNGDGTFSTNASAGYVSSYADGVFEPAPADFNGDGKVDIPALSEYGDAAIYLGKGNGLFAGAPVVAPPSDDAYYDKLILAANLTGKGFNDVLLYDNNNYDSGGDLMVGANDGHGNFTYTEALSADALSTIAFPYVEPFSVDINGDGYADILIGDTYGGLYYALNKADGSGTFATPVALNLGGSVGCTILYGATGDVNGDGKTDIVLAFDGCGTGDFTSTGLFTLLNNGDGTFTPSFSPTPSSEPYSVYLADFNNDGKLDAAIIDDEAAVTLVPGVGDGTFDGTHAVETALYASSDIYGMATGDYDGDGKQDLVLFGYQNYQGIVLLKGNGDFTFQAGPTYLVHSYGAGGQLVDLNGDGFPDLVFNYYADGSAPYPSTGYILNTGKGGFNTPVLLSSTFNEGYDGQNEGYGTPIVVADFNQDGAPDFASVSYYTSGIFYNMGGISLALTASSPTATQDSSVTLTAALTPSLGTAAATGTVTFYDNGTAIGAESVSGNAATLSLSTLPVGANAITAVYSGDANYNIVSSTASVNMTAVSVTALPPAFTMATVSGSTLSLTAGQTGVATFSVTGNATFNGAITFACTGAPAGSTCTVTPGSVTLAGVQTSTVSVVIATTDANNHYSATNSFPTWLKTSGGITLAGGLLLLWPSRRRRNLWTLVLVGTIGLGAMVSIIGCSSSKFAGTPTGSYTVNVTGTAGALTQTGTIAVTVQQ